jgi:branched-chain amino acid transport system permease protein
MSTAIQMITGSIALMIIGVAAGELGRFHPAAVTTRSFLGWAYLVTFGSLVGFTAYSYLLRETTPAKATTYAYVNPVVAVLLGWAVAHERITPSMMIGAAIILGAGLYLLLTRTRIGTSIRALAVNPLAARLVAIDVPRMSAFTFALGGALCAAGGVLISTFFTFNAAMGVQFTMKALIVVIMGGAGNILGAVAAGLLLGVAETSVARLIDPGLTLAVNFALFILVLLIRPTGLFGRAT